MSKVSETIQQLRRSKGITQEELAEKTGLSLSSIVDYENERRNPNFKAMVALENFFGVTAEALLGGSSSLPKQAKAVPAEECQNKERDQLLKIFDQLPKEYQLILIGKASELYLRYQKWNEEVKEAVRRTKKLEKVARKFNNSAPAQLEKSPVELVLERMAEFGTTTPEVDITCLASSQEAAQSIKQVMERNQTEKELREQIECYGVPENVYIDSPSK